MTIDECINYLGYRIDAIQQPLLNVNVPFLNGVSAVDGKLRVRSTRLCKMHLPDHKLKEVDRLWQVGIYDDTNTYGVSVFEGNNLLEALNKAVDYVKNQVNYKSGDDGNGKA